MVERWAERIRIACSAGVLASLAAALLAGRHWPLVGDAALMHSVVFLLRHGMVAYRDIVDVNLPGTYFFEALGMRIFGEGAAGWRLYDSFLLVLVVGASFILGRKSGSWSAGVTGGGLFALIHLQDGLMQVGQRDLLMAVLLLWSYVALFAMQTGRYRLLMAFVFGLVIGTNGTIKPVLIPLGVVLLLLGAWEVRGQSTYWKIVATGATGMLVPLLASGLWIYRTGALEAFLHRTRPLLVLHASLSRQPLAYLLTHVLAPVGFVGAVWLLLAASERAPVSRFRGQMYVGLIGAGAAFLFQGKGLPYQRYPFLALLLVVVCIDLGRMLSAGKWHSYGAATVFLGMACVLAPGYAWTASTFSSATPFEKALGSRLDQLQSGGSLTGKVQCLDTFGGCLGVLYEKKIEQTSGFLYDCYLFSAPSATRDRYRAAFLAAFLAKLPKVVIETDQFCFKYSQGFSRVEQWPEFDDILKRRYSSEPVWKSAEMQHWWHRREMPVAFRIYRRRDQ